ncbi:hypothetical protein L3X38_000010 [Prunus dulcis]|uniref:Uncharacterized protein n=1 Tax=Prunus dulcis TaxID=3755 RepID=A0AAD4UQG4_PRUDU|nr:hypothetical protein L3X38_000010 [Prunus dulcis]
MSDTATKEEGTAAVADLIELLLEHWAEESLQPNSPISLIEFLHELDDGNVLTIDDLDPASAEIEDNHSEVQDPLSEINVGTQALPRPLFISILLCPKLSVEVTGLLCEYKDCFAWDHHSGFLPRYNKKSRKRLNDSLKMALSALPDKSSGWPTLCQY